MICAQGFQGFWNKDLFSGAALLHRVSSPTCSLIFKAYVLTLPHNVRYLNLPILWFSKLLKSRTDFLKLPCCLGDLNLPALWYSMLLLSKYGFFICFVSRVLTFIFSMNLKALETIVIKICFSKAALLCRIS